MGIFRSGPRRKVVGPELDYEEEVEGEADPDEDGLDASLPLQAQGFRDSHQGLLPAGREGTSEP